MDRRALLRCAVGAGVALAGIAEIPVPAHAATASRMIRRRAAPSDSVLEHAAANCPVDTIVIVMMENRSFDHYLGWLADDTRYLDAGRRRYGRDFSVNGRVRQAFVDPSGTRVPTRPAKRFEPEKVETRGCTFNDPGHSWDLARIQRDQGFLAAGTGDDDYAITYYTASDLPFYAALARRFTVFDRWHSSLLGPTFPNRQYFLSAQSEGRKDDAPGAPVGVFRAETIVERLAAAGVSVGYYYTNVPLLAFWPLDRIAAFIRPLDRYFEDAATGNLPHVVFVEPHFGVSDAHRTDDHPYGDITLGQRWVRAIFGAFASSPQWQHGAFVLTYDEGGGFFDHVRPPMLPDDRTSKIDGNNFGQAGFRVPALLASPYAQRGAVDDRLYDHTSVARFLEWRFLGAAAEGPGRRGRWALTRRDRNAHNPGKTLRADHPDPELRFNLALPIRQPAPSCTPQHVAARPPPRDTDRDPFDRPDLLDLAGRFPPAIHRPWLADVTVRLGRAGHPDGVRYCSSGAGRSPADCAALSATSRFCRRSRRKCIRMTSPGCSLPPPWMSSRPSFIVSRHSTTARMPQRRAMPGTDDVRSPKGGRNSQGRAPNRAT
jgi:phospholipase C